MPLRISRFDFGGRPLPSSRSLRFGNMGSIIAHCSSDNSSRFAIYEKYMTLLQCTSHFFIFEIASNIITLSCVCKAAEDIFWHPDKNFHILS